MKNSFVVIPELGQYIWCFDHILRSSQSFVLCRGHIIDIVYVLERVVNCLFY